MKITLKLAGLALVLMALLYGCGDDKASGPVADNYVFPAGNATLTFSAMSTATLAAPISGLDIAVVLPSGMSVATTSGVSGQIQSAAITPGTALSGTNLAFGSYSASSGKTRLSMATTSSNYRLGEFLRLTCSVAPNTAISLATVKGLNTPVTVTKAVGYDAISKSTVDLTGKLAVSLGAVR
jgi:hypothetical protein